MYSVYCIAQYSILYYYMHLGDVLGLVLRLGLRHGRVQLEDRLREVRGVLLRAT